METTGTFTITKESEVVKTGLTYTEVRKFVFQKEQKSRVAIVGYYVTNEQTKESIPAHLCE